MSASIRLLDKYKNACSLNSDSACAESLGVTRGAVHLWKKGTSHPDAVSIGKMCNKLGEPLIAWLPLIEAERAHSPAAKKVWLQMAQAAASIAGAYLIFKYVDQTTAEAFLITPLYIMRN